MHTCGPRGTCVDGVNSHSCDCDPGFQWKDIDGDAIVVIVLCFARRQGAPENPMRAADAEKLVFDIFVGESGDRLVIIQLRGEERFPCVTITFALIRIEEKIAERSSPKLV